MTGWLPSGPRRLAIYALEVVRGLSHSLLFAAIAALILCALAAVLPGCGASAATQGAYALEQARCIANEREIVDRQGSTLAEDQAALAAERARCDAALDAIEEAD